jgi:dUTP pyrophosphatase
MLVLEFAKIHPDAVLPKFQSSGASGADLHAVLPESVCEIILRPGERQLIPTGLKANLPQGTELQIRPRSGLAYKFGVTVLNTPGTIDSDYRGELKILLCNLGSEAFKIHHLDRIAQIVMANVVQFSAQEIPEDLMGETDRGAGGFGSTGIAQKTGPGI